MTVFPDVARTPLTRFVPVRGPGVGPIAPMTPATPLGGFTSKGTYLRSQVFGR